MDPATIALITFGIQEFIKVAPKLVDEFAALFSKGAPTDADWDALRAKILSKSYKDYVPTTQLPDEETT
jgi:hypothetical protein